MISAHQKRRRLSTIASRLAFLAGAVVLGPGAGLTLEAQQAVVSPAAAVVHASDPRGDLEQLQSISNARRSIDLELADLWPSRLPTTLSFTCNGKPCYIWLMDKDRGLLLLRNELPCNVPVWGRLYSDGIRAFGMYAPIERHDGQLVIRWPAGPGHWLSNGNADDLRSDDHDDGGKFFTPRIITRQYFIDGKQAFTHVLGRGGESDIALFENERGEPPSFGRVLEKEGRIDAFEMKADIVQKDGLYIIDWAAGPGSWQRPDLERGGFGIQKAGKRYPTDVVLLDTGDYLLINENLNEKPSLLRFRSPSVGRAVDWGLDVSIRLLGNEQHLDFTTNGSVWQRILRRQNHVRAGLIR